MSSIARAGKIAVIAIGLAAATGPDLSALAQTAAPADPLSLHPMSSAEQRRLYQGDVIPYTVAERSDRDLAVGLTIFVLAPLAPVVEYLDSGQIILQDGTISTYGVIPDPPRPDAVYVDERDKVWVSDFGGYAMFRFDAGSETFERFGFPREAANVRQMLGRAGEVWLPESGTEHISVIRTV